MSRGTIEFGPYRLESGPARLRRESETIALRPKSLKVLAYLARHPGRLVTKEELREQVWGTTHVSDTRVRVTVHEVRAALGGDQDSREYLETVPGRGYRFVATDETTALDDARSTPDVPPLRGGSPPIVGRERELEHLVNRFLEADRGERRLTFLGGEPGVGKTALVDLFLEHLAGRPHTICVRGQCVMHYGAGEAYAPVLEALGRMGQDRAGHALTRVLDHYAPMWLAQLPALVDSEELERLQRQVQGATKDRMVRELNDALERLTEKDTLVLVLEDLHWSDMATLDLLAAIAQRPEPARLLIVGTYRPAEAIVRAPEFRAVMLELEGHGQCEQLNLELLSRGGVAAYVRARIDGEGTDDVATAVYERSDGNALFMVNLLEHLIDTHAVRRSDGHWVVDGASAGLTQVPEGLRPLIERRLDVLSDDDRELLEAASIVGVEFAAAACPVLPHSGEEQDPESVETHLESIANHTRLIDPCGTSEWSDRTLTAHYRFGHGLYRDVLYEQIHETRRARLHRRVGERLQEAWGRDAPETAAALADHFERGRDPGNAARYRRMAGERALGQHAYHEAARHFQAALDAFDQARHVPADGDPEDPVRWELEVCTALGTTLSATLGYSDPEVARTNSRARSLIERLDDPASQFPVLFNLWSRSNTAADHAESTNLVTRMSELAAETENDELAMMVASAAARTQFNLGDLAGCAEHMLRLLTPYDPLRLADVHDRYGHVDHAIDCLGYNAQVLWLQGYPDQALAQTREARKLGEHLDRPYSEAVAGYVVLPTLQFCGDTEQLDRQARDLNHLSAEQGYALWLAWATCFEGWAAGARGNLGEGIALMERGVDAFRGTGTRAHLPHLLALLAELCLRAGRIEVAGEWLAEARAQAESSGERYWEAELHRLEGEVLLAAPGGGDHDARAEACFRRALEVAGGQGAISLELRAALNLSRLGRSPDAHQLLGDVLGRFTQGHDTADLRAALTQLSAIHPSADD